VTRTHAPTAWRRIAIRALRPDEGHLLELVHERLGPQSRLQRYLAPKPRLSRRDLDDLSAVDGHHHVALVALVGVPAEPIGVARYLRYREAAVAEIAVEVVDAWQRRGVGRLLLTQLRAHALRAEIDRFQWTAFECNGAAAALARDLGEVRAERLGGGVRQSSAAIAGPGKRERSPRGSRFAYPRSATRAVQREWRPRSSSGVRSGRPSGA
jgi:RimJ/RimL family protein N-acetyltransferase